MKRILILIAVSASLTAVAQEGSGVIKTNPMGWFAGQYQFGYEHFLSEKASIQLMPGGIFGSVSLTSSTLDSTSYPDGSSLYDGTAGEGAAAAGPPDGRPYSK